MSERLDALLTRLELKPPAADDPFTDLGLHVDDEVVAMGVSRPGRLTGADAEIDEIGRLLFRCLFFLYYGGLERTLEGDATGERDIIVELWLLRQELPEEIRSILGEFTSFLGARGIALNVIMTTEQALRPPS